MDPDLVEETLRKVENRNASKQPSQDDERVGDRPSEHGKAQAEEILMQALRDMEDNRCHLVLREKRLPMFTSKEPVDVSFLNSEQVEGIPGAWSNINVG